MIKRLVDQLMPKLPAPTSAEEEEKALLEQAHREQQEIAARLAALETHIAVVARDDA